MVVEAVKVAPLYTHDIKYVFPVTTENVEI